MSDYTNGNYTKTGKKVKCINSRRIDLTYNKVYDVFIDNKGDEFIIDDSRYWSISDNDYYELGDDVAEATDNANNVNNVNTTNENTPKFKVGDKVKVISTDYICKYDKNIKVGDVGVITNINYNPVDPYRVKFNETDEKDGWCFTDKCIELVGDDEAIENTTNKKYNPLVVQQSGNHYKNGKIQPIEYSERNNLSMCQGNIVKYITRHKEKNGVDDLAKVVHYALLEALFVYGEDGATELRDKVDSLINIENKE